MATDTYEVIADQYTVHKQVGENKDPITGTVTSIQQGQGKVYFKGDVIPASEISPETLNALEDEDHPSHEYVAARLSQSGDDPREALSPRLGEPFAGYDDMDEDEVVQAMKNLPSRAITKIKEYETDHEGREAIVGYNIGFAESPVARQTGAVSSPHQDGDEEKATTKLTTREVPEEGVVQVGEGVTGTGDPQIPHGSIKEEAEGGGKKGAARRRSRRARPASGGDSGGSGDSGSND